MVVCRYWEQGNCRFGQNCKFEHTNQAQSGNRFAAFGGGGNNNNNSGGAFGSNNSNASNPYNISREVIERDLTLEAPTWIFSAYSPSKDTPEQLFGGETREKSFEEMRLLHLQAEASGNVQQAVNAAQQLWQQCKQQNQNILSDIDGATRFINESGNKHPNRIDICKQGSQGGSTGAFAKGAQPSAIGQANPFGSNASTTSSNPFGSTAATPSANPFGSNAAAASSNPFGPTGQAGNTGFGQTSALGQKASPFGAPAFGQASQPTSSAFGKPAFGQPSQPTSAFGQAAQSTSSPFGQAGQSTTSPFGQSGQNTTSGFGQAAQNTTSAFGQAGQNTTSAFGQAAQTTSSPFGQPAQNAPSAFGQPSSLGQKASAFGAPAFGQTAQPSAGQGAFGQPSALGQKVSPFGGGAANASSPFGSAGGSAAPASLSPFGSTTNTSNTANPFSQNTTGQTNSSPFGQAAQKPSPFGQASQPVQSSPFGQAAQAPAAASPFGQEAKPAAANPFGQPAQAATSSPFAQTAQSSNAPAANNPFGQAAKPQANGFGGAAQANPFGQAQNQAQQKPSPFGQPQGGAFGSQAAPAAPASSNAAATGQGKATGPYSASSTKQHPPLDSYARKNMSGQLAQWKNRPVSYKDGLPGYQGPSGAWTRIWFPDGAPMYYRDTELAPEEYDDKSKAQWMAFEQSGTFTDGIMPALPPLRDVCTWDI